MVEFLVAAFVFAVGILGLTALQLMSIRQATTGRGRVTATYVAEQVLQQAQMEGQASYFGKIQRSPINLTRVFTDLSGTAIALRPFAGFNVDGVQVSTIDPDTGTATDLADLATRVPDANKRSPVYTVRWARRPYAGTPPPSTGAQSQEFVVNVEWAEEAGLRYLSMSRNIRY